MAGSGRLALLGLKAADMAAQVRAVEGDLLILLQLVAADAASPGLDGHREPIVSEDGQHVVELETHPTVRRVANRDALVKNRFAVDVHVEPVARSDGQDRRVG